MKLLSKRFPLVVLLSLLLPHAASAQNNETRDQIAELQAQVAELQAKIEYLTSQNAAGQGTESPPPKPQPAPALNAENASPTTFEQPPVIVEPAPMFVDPAPMFVDPAPMFVDPLLPSCYSVPHYYSTGYRFRDDYFSYRPSRLPYFDDYYPDYGYGYGAGISIGGFGFGFYPSFRGIYGHPHRGHHRGHRWGHHW